MKQRFEAWSEAGQLSFGSAEFIADQRAKGLIGAAAEFLYVVEADTWEEASSIHNLRMGFGPYTPEGSPEPCPKCNAWFYPQGSGQCWRCGPVR